MNPAKASEPRPGEAVQRSREARLLATDVRFYETATAADIDRRLRALGRVRAGWDAILGYCAHAVKQSRLHSLLGFASFRHYVEERLGLPARAVEQRAALENQVALCGSHHLRCIHGGWLRVFGRAPDDLTWLLGGKEWTGPGLER